jgi:NADH dehydrogenase FAD-containing subunit
VKGAIERLDGDGVIFTDGNRQQLDAIVWATGYKISFPFFEAPELTPDSNNRFDLFKRMVRPGFDNLFFMGLAQPLPTLVNFAEQQSKLVANYLTGTYALPDPETTRKTIQADDEFHTGHFYNSPRHTIQVDFHAYCADLQKELKRGASRARSTGNAIPVPARAASLAH